MERIRRALEQAEQDRSNRKEIAPLPMERSKPAREAISNLAPDTAPVSDIRFQRTRTIDVPEDLLEAHRLVAALPGHELTDVYRILRTRVLQAMNSNRWNSLAITSPATGAGKTLTAINLAISLAREVNRTVLLTDFDLRNPSIHTYFGYDPEFDLSDYLFNDVPLEEILFSPSIERLVVLPGGESIHNSSETLRSPKMVALVEELKSRYDDRLVIFDIPPVLEIDDALAFAPYTDAMLMVAGNGATRREDLESALQLLKGTPIIGTVLNKAEGLGTSGYKKRGNKA
jgi:protein-tyrosine kinase